MQQENLRQIYRNRFKKVHKGEKNRIWKILCEEYFQQFINKEDTVLDIGAGYGEFINNIKAKRKIAVDLNKDIENYVDENVELVINNCKSMQSVGDKQVDKIFISNFLEHLRSSDEVLQVLIECFRVLKTGGKIMILQPNIYYVKEKYWYFIDHKIPLTHESLVEALELCGFKIQLLHKKFLPYSTKSNLPQHSFLVKLYLKVPVLWHFFGKQTFVVAEKL